MKKINKITKRKLFNKIKIARFIALVGTFLILTVFLFIQVSCSILPYFKPKVSEITTSVESSTLKRPELFVISHLKIPGQAIDVKSQGDYAYLTNDLGILFVIDIKDKGNPKIIGKCTGIDSANIVMIQGDYAYVSYTIWVNPKQTGETTQQQTTEGNVTIYSICGFKIIDIKDKKNPKVVGDYISGQHENETVEGLIIDGNYAYLNSTKIIGDTSEEGRLEVVDMSIKNSPKLFGYCQVEGEPNGLFVQGNYAYLNATYYDFKKQDYTNKSKLFVIDISNKKSPTVIGSCEVPSNSWSVYVKDNFAYCTSSIYDQEAKKYNSSLLQVVDISDQKNPKILGECDIPGGAWEIDMKNNFLLISNNEGGVSVVDITDSKKPALVTMLKTGGNSYDITINGDYGYIADGFQGLDIIGLQKKQPGLTASEGNAAPVAVISAYGDRLANEDFIDENPIYFSAMDSYDPEGVNLTYKWLINGNEIKDSNTESKDSQLVASSSFFASNPLILENGKELSCIFKNPGKYSVTLKVSDGALTSEDTKSITVANQNLSIIPIKELRFNVTEECLLLNNSNILLKNIECYLRTPQTYYPYQTVNSVNTSISTVDQVFDNCWNLIEHFKFDKSVSLAKGEQLKAGITDNVTMYEYDFKNLNTKGMGYKIGDPDLQEYTGDDLFIDTDNITIINAVKTAVGGETDPVIKAKKIYNYVAGKLSYDFQRASNKNYEFMNASEILKVGKGVCADYAILYTALLRASGIPARIIGGIPVTIILTQKDKTTDEGHAWVEVKLPGYGWIPVNITQEEGFMNTDYYLDLATEKGTTFLYENKTMDWGSYYYEGFKFKWDGMQIPNVEQTITYKVNNIDLNDLTVNK